uniref:Photosynthesis system II assembly factor Ycf48/Hcf136-like domain-containing protein n=2 Tax=viral metagenome TaxID=1070528 RepID=A0A6H1Z7P9_9ZZZZ
MALPIQTFRSSPFKGISEKVAPHLLDDGESPSCNGIQSEPVGAISKQKGSLKWITTNIPPNPVNGICAFKPSDTQEIDVISGSEFRRYNVNGVYQTPNKTGIRTVLFSCDKDNKTIYTHSYGGSFDITQNIESFTVANNPYGVAFDGTNLWYCDQVLNKLYKLSGISGTQLAEYPAPTGANISGLCWDGTNLWACGYSDNRVYKVNIITGVFTTYVFEVALFTVGMYLTGIAWDGTHLWITIKLVPKVAKYTTAGVFISSFDPPKTCNSGWSDIATTLDGQKWYAIGSGDVYLSIDFGNTWTKILLASGWNFTSVAVSGNGKYISALHFNTLSLFSNDYGATWIERFIDGVKISMSLAGDRQTVIKSPGYIYTSSDFGVTWTERTLVGSKNWTDIAVSTFGMNQTAVVSPGYIYVSNDGGDTWVERTLAGSRNWSGITMGWGMNQYACVISGCIYTSNNAGDTWVERTLAGSRNWMDIKMSLESVVDIAVTFEGGIYKSIDLGATWTLIKNTNKSLYGVAISPDGQKIMIASRFTATSGEIIISLDSGITWTDYFPSDITVVESNNLIISDGFIHKFYKTDQLGILLQEWEAPASNPSGLTYVASIPTVFSNNKFDFTIFMNTLFFCNGSHIYKWTGSGNNFTIVYDASNQTKYLALFENRLLSAGHNASDVCYSNLLDPETGYIDNYIPVNPDDGDKITGIIVHSNSLIVFKEKSKWRMSPTGDYDNPFYLTKINDVGTISHHSLIIVNDMVYFCNLNGVYRFTGASSEKISTKIDTSYKTWLKGTLTSIDVVYVKELNQIRWTIQSSLTDDPSTIVYNLLTDSWFVLNDYAPQGGGWISTNFCVIKPWETSATEIILASSKNYLMQTNDGDSFDVQTNKAIPSVMTSKVFDFGFPNKQKTIKRGYFTVKNEVSSYNITLSVSVDGKAFEVLSPVVVNDPTGGNKITQLIDLKEKIGKTFQFKFENNGENQPWTLYEYVIEYQVLPRII